MGMLPMALAVQFIADGLAALGFAKALANEYWGFYRVKEGDDPLRALVGFQALNNLIQQGMAFTEQIELGFGVW